MKQLKFSDTKIRWLLVFAFMLVFASQAHASAAAAFLRTLVFIVLVMALLVGANTMMSGLFGTGAVVSYPLPAVHGAASHVGLLV